MIALHGDRFTAQHSGIGGHFVDDMNTAGLLCFIIGTHSGTVPTHPRAEKIVQID
jgi:hypothetical protein